MVKNMLFTINVFDERHALVHELRDITFMPYPGLIMVCGSETDTWQVKEVQISVQMPGSSAERNNNPTHLEVVAKRIPGSHGIH